MCLQFRYVAMSHQLKRGGKTRPDRVLSARQPGVPGADTTTEKSHEWSANAQRIVVLWPKPANVTLYRKLSRKGYIVSLKSGSYSTTGYAIPTMTYTWTHRAGTEIDHDRVGRWWTHRDCRRLELNHIKMVLLRVVCSRHSSTLLLIDLEIRWTPPLALISSNLISVSLTYNGWGSKTGKLCWPACFLRKKCKAECWNFRRKIAGANSNRLSVCSCRECDWIHPTVLHQYKTGVNLHADAKWLSSSHNTKTSGGISSDWVANPIFGRTTSCTVDRIHELVWRWRAANSRP